MATSVLGRTATVKPGDTLLILIPHSEVAMHMRIAGRPMPVRITEGPHPMAQILSDYAHPFGGAVTLGEAGLRIDNDGTIHSDAIIALHVDWAPTVAAGKFYVYAEGQRIPNPFARFEDARAEARRIGGDVRHATTNLTPPFWARFAPVSPDAEVTYTYEVQGRNSESHATLWSEKYTDFTNDEQAIAAAKQLAAGWGHAQAARDAHVLDDRSHDSYLFGGRKILWKR
jgi:hypothetical protein